MIFRFNDKEYRGATAVEVIAQMERDEADFATQNGGTLRQFLEWFLKKLSDRLPPRTRIKPARQRRSAGAQLSIPAPRLRHRRTRRIKNIWFLVCVPQNYHLSVAGRSEII
jgi:hypothetical protein